MRKAVLQVGARSLVTNTWIPTRELFEDMLHRTPWLVEFVQTNPFTQGFGPQFLATDGRLHSCRYPLVLAVTGGNPWLETAWRAQVEPAGVQLLRVVA